MKESGKRRCGGGGASRRSGQTPARETLLPGELAVARSQRATATSGLLRTGYRVFALAAAAAEAEGSA
jgi:hypothetical protein